MNKVLDRFQVSSVISFMNCKSHRLEMKQFMRGSTTDKDWNKMGQADAWAKAAEWIQDMIGDSEGLKVPAVADIDEVADYLTSITPERSLFGEMRDYTEGFEEAQADVACYIEFVLINMGKPEEDE